MTAIPVAAWPPTFVRVTVNPACDPASTVAASAVLPIVRNAFGLLHDGTLKLPMRVRQLNSSAGTA